jgi:hypothetical protein
MRCDFFKLKKWETARRSKFHGGGGVEYFTAAPMSAELTTL